MTKINHIKAINWLILYRKNLSFFSDFKAGILKNPGIRLNPKGYNNDRKKLVRVSVNKCDCVLEYTLQKSVIQYQLNANKINPNTLNNINLYLKLFNKERNFVTIIFISFNFFMLIIDFCDNDKCFKITVIVEEITLEYNICGI